LGGSGWLLMKQTDSFFAGIITGIGVIAIVFIGLDLTPVATQQRIQAEAVKHGAAEWIVKVDQEGNATVEFVWKKP